MTLQVTPQIMADAVSRLRAAGCVFAEDEAELVMSEARTPAELDDMLEQRIAGLPLEHVVGWAEFCGLRISVDPRVFVPRPRTEFLAAQAIELARGAAHPVVVDLCCGSGALGAVIAASVPGVELYAADIDPAAVRCARRNVAAVGEVFEGDLYEALPASLRGRVNVLVANVPYVPSGDVELMPREARLYEALVALDGGGDGLDVVRPVATGAASWLALGGHLLIETSERQAPMALEIFEGSGLAARVAASEDFDATIVIGRT